MNEWIAIAERKPNPEGQFVVVFGRAWVGSYVADGFFSIREPGGTYIPFVEAGYYFEDDNGVESWQLACNAESDITHWLPLPETP